MSICDARMLQVLSIRVFRRRSLRVANRGSGLRSNAIKEVKTNIKLILFHSFVKLTSSRRRSKRRRGPTPEREANSSVDADDFHKTLSFCMSA